MATRKVKSAPKHFISNQEEIETIVINEMKKISDIVGSTLGPGGRVVMIESDDINIPNKVTKDGVTVFKSLGSIDPYSQLIIEIARDAAIRTGDSAGDGSSTSTILASNLVQKLLKFCKDNPKFSPQKAMRIINECLNKVMLPAIKSKAILVDNNNTHLLEQVAKVSANGDEDIAKAVIEAFNAVGYGANSHITIQECTGSQRYEVDLIEGYPIPIGYEDSCGMHFDHFINDRGNLRCILDKPIFILFDGLVADLGMFNPIINQIGSQVAEGKPGFMNIVFVAHDFAPAVLEMLAINFQNSSSINILPIKTPINQLTNCQLNFLEDLSAFTGAKVFGLHNQIVDCTLEDYGHNMTKFECSRTRSTLSGEPDSLNIEVQADIIRTRINNPESQIEKILLEERLGRLTNGIAKLKIFGGSTGELREKHDRVEDAICSVRNTITYGCLPAGGRLLLDLALLIIDQENVPELSIYKKEDYLDVTTKVLFYTLLSPVQKLLDNAGYNNEEQLQIIDKLLKEPELILDVANGIYGRASELGLYDSFGAVYNALENSVSIASVLGTAAGMVVFPRDDVLERSEAKAEKEWLRNLKDANNLKNEVNSRM